MSIFEALMLIGFGISWPLSVAKTIRTKKVDGKSPYFMGAVALGYVFGIIHKILFSGDLIILIYIFNLCMVIWDILLYYRYSTKKKTTDHLFI